MFGWKQYKMNPTKVVLLACGSYNPVTIMHLRMFEIARDALNKSGRFQVVGGYISPVGDSYKKKDLLPAKQRCAMLKVALKTSDWIKLDSWECEQSSWIESIKVLRHIKQLTDSQCNVTSNVKPSPKRRKKQQVSDVSQNKLPKIEVDEDQVPTVRFLCGADLLESFAVPGLWKDEDIEQIVSNHGLVVINREGSNAARFIYESDVLSKYRENIILVNEWLSLDISSTKIRRALRRGESIKYVVQDSVIDYIKEHRLYGVPDNKFINHITPSPNAENAKSPIEEDDCPSTNNSISNINHNTSHNNNNTNNGSGEISVVLRSSQGGGYSGRHVVPAQRMSMTMSPTKRHEHQKYSTENGGVGSGRVTCMADIGTLVKKMKNVRVGFTPETCV